MVRNDYYYYYCYCFCVNDVMLVNLAPKTHAHMRQAIHLCFVIVGTQNVDIFRRCQRISSLLPDFIEWCKLQKQHTHPRFKTDNLTKEAIRVDFAACPESERDIFSVSLSCLVLYTILIEENIKTIP